MAEITEVRVSPTLITVIYDDGYERIVNRKHANRVDELARVLFHIGNDPDNPLDRSDAPSGQDNKKLSSGRVREAIEALSGGEKAELFESLRRACRDREKSLPPQDDDDRSEGPCIREGRLDRT